jgi:hypothetical protein
LCACANGVRSRVSRLLLPQADLDELPSMMEVCLMV